MILLGKQNMTAQAISALLISAALWAGAFINPPEMPSINVYAPLYDWIYLNISSYRLLCVILAFVLSFIEGLWLNIILYNHKIIPQNNLMPMLFYMLAMGCTSHTLSPMLIINAVLLLMLTQVLATSTPTIGIDKIFNGACCMGLCFLIYPPSIVLAIPFVLYFTIYKLYSWNSVAMLLLGFMAPIIPYLTYHLIVGDHTFVTYLLVCSIEDFNIGIRHLTPIAIAAHGLMLVAIITALAYTTQRRHLVLQQKNTQVIVALLLFSLLAHLYSTLLPIDMGAFAIPFAFIVTNFFTAEKKRRWVDDCAYLLLIATCAVFSYKCH